MAAVPQFTCDNLKINLQLAGINGFSGSAKRYGAFQAAVDTTQDRTIQNLDPRNCVNHVNIVEVASGGNGNRPRYGATIKWETPDCNEYTDTCGAFTCTDGEASTPTTSETVFKIDECVKMNINIPYKVWKDSCCGVEEYYTKIINARAKGATPRDLQSLINSLAGTTLYNRAYETRLVAEKLNTTLVGRFGDINTYVLAGLAAGKGYNFVPDAYTGAPVGNAVWEVPVFELPEAGYVARFDKVINPEAFRLELQRFVDTHPNCSQGITIIGGRAINNMLGTLDMRCCDSTGINQAQAIRKVMGIMANYYMDDTIDVLYPNGTFFIIENNSLALFWLALQTDPARRKEDIQGISGIFRQFSTLSVPVSDCRNDGMLMTFDSLLTAKVATCLDDVAFNLQLRAEYELFTMPAIGCVNPRTGIYQGLMVNRLQPTPVPTPTPTPV